MIQNILNYDTFSYLFILFQVIILYNYILKKQSLIYIVFLAIITASSIATRFPNILSLCFIPLIILCFHYKKEKILAFKRIFLFIILTIIFYFSLVYFVFHDLPKFINSFSDNISNTGYSLLDLIKSYVNGFVQIVLNSFLILGLFFFYYKKPIKTLNKIFYFTPIALFLIYYYFFIFNYSFGWKLSLV